MLIARKLAKRFGAVEALRGVDLDLHAGEVHCLLGENGAGKSTLIKCLTGVVRPDAGEITLDGVSFAPDSPRAAEDAGLSTVYQELDLIPHFSLAENVVLGRESTRRFGRIDHRAVRERARRALERLGLDLPVQRELASCSPAIWQLVAIARALDAEAKVLILDEPTSSLDRDEVELLFQILRELAESGLAILFITHFLDQVEAVGDRITVLRDGRRVLCESANSLQRSELVHAMVGRELEEAIAGSGRSFSIGGEPLLEAQGLARRHAVESFDLSLRPGECVGLAGLLGSGRSESARLLSGVDGADAGDLRVHGETRRFETPRAALREGIVLLPEDRKVEGLVFDLTVRQNIELAFRAREGLRRRSDLRERVVQLIERLGIRCPSPDVPVGSLSGGNQQKALLARCLLLDPQVLILDEPVRGVDVGAKDEILSVIEELRKDGLALLFISSEPEETLRCCTRVLVLRERRVVAELQAEELDPKRLLDAIAESTDACED